MQESLQSRIEVDHKILSARLPGWSIHALEEVDSTNRYAKALTQTPALVIAEEQSGGRGRLGRTFFSPTGGLYLSVRLPVTFAVEEAQLLTSIASVAASDALWETFGKRCQIKWINDLYYQQKKVCGILTEGVVDPESGALVAVVVGMGINLLSAIPPSLAAEATSLFDPASHGCLDATLAVIAIVNKMVQIIKALPDRSYLARYREHSLLLGKEIYLWEAGVKREAIALDVDRWARLVVQLPDAEVRTIHSPEVSVRLAR